METAIAVVDGKLTNEQIGGLYRRVSELTRRMNEGTLEYDWVMSELQRTVEGRITGELRQWNVWRTIKLGTGLRTAGEFGIALKQAECRIGDRGNDILGKPAFTASETEMEVDLVNVSVADLGFKDGAIRKDIYRRAIELGLELCPAEVGPQLRLQYRDQPKGEWLLVAMEPITDSDGGPGLFGVERGGRGLWLGAGDGRPDRFWDSNGRWVFRLRRK